MMRFIVVAAILVGGGALLPTLVPWVMEDGLGVGREVTPEQRVEGMVRRGVERYNARIASRATPELVPQELRIAERSLVMPYTLNGMIAPGARNEMTEQLRQTMRRAACSDFRFAIIEGWRVTAVVTDLAGAQIRVTIGPNDC